MTRREVIDKLAPHMAELRQMGVSSLALFGSAARGESGVGSDLDLLIAFDRTISLFHFLKVQVYAPLASSNSFRPDGQTHQ